MTVKDILCMRQLPIFLNVVIISISLFFYEYSAVLCWNIVFAAEPMDKSEKGFTDDSHTDVPQ